MRQAISERRLTLVTRGGCHLCEEAEAVLRDAGAAFEVVDVDSDDELVRLYDWRVPVILANGTPVLEGRIDTASLRRVLVSWRGPEAPPPG